RLYWSAPWYVVGPPLDNLVVIRQTVGPPSPLRASNLSSKWADFVPPALCLAANSQLVVNFSGQLRRNPGTQRLRVPDLSSVFGGASGIRTPDPLPARHGQRAVSHLNCHASR